jgi:hypothetical protein
MHAIGGDDYVRLLNQTLRENLKKAGFSETFLNEMIAPVMKVNYGQSTDINAFVGKPELEEIRASRSPIGTEPPVGSLVLSVSGIFTDIVYFCL